MNGPGRGGPILKNGPIGLKKIVEVRGSGLRVLVVVAVGRRT